MKRDNFSILLIEDSSEQRGHIIRILSEEGYTNIHEATNGKEALKLFSGELFESVDLVIADILMPVMNGLEFLEHMKKSEIVKHRETPVLMISTSSEMENVCKAIDLGAMDYIFKPIEKSRLIEKINTVLSEKN